MGTRSLTHIKTETGKTLLTIYRQFDGYPEGHGIELAKAILNHTGGRDRFGDDKQGNNGVQCMAAWIIHELKQSCGNIYIEPTNSKNCWEEFTYTVRESKGGLYIIGILDSDSKCIFKGTPAALLAQFERAKK